MDSDQTPDSEASTEGAAPPLLSALSDPTPPGAFLIKGNGPADGFGLHCPPEGVLSDPTPPGAFLTGRTLAALGIGALLGAAAVLLLDSRRRSDRPWR